MPPRTVQIHIEPRQPKQQPSVSFSPQEIRVGQQVRVHAVHAAPSPEAGAGGASARGRKRDRPSLWPRKAGCSDRSEPVAPLIEVLSHPNLLPSC
ncbi:hypothetical protein U1Q18_005065 [Sarracenia purpurea var. burkii]